MHLDTNSIELTSQPRGKVDVSRHAEVSRVDNLIRRWVVEDRLGVNTSLVGEGAETGDGRVALSCQLDTRYGGEHNSETEMAYNGMLTSTACATRSSISLSLCSLYLLIT